MANPKSGHIDWSRWSFDYDVADSEGLTLRNVIFDGTYILYRASLPAIRVKYVKDSQWWDPLNWFNTGCGPFLDQIQWQYSWWEEHVHHKFLRPVYWAGCVNELVCIQAWQYGPTEWLTILVLPQLGAYDIVQAWHLSSNGWLLPRVSSRGIQCNFDHTHHPYWRLDFDVSGWENRVYVRHGGQWGYYVSEVNDVKDPDGTTLWVITNVPKGFLTHSVRIFPGPNDGHADSFSSMDAGVRLYHYPEEVRPWPFATGPLGFDDAEFVGDSDIVFWYVAHMFHRPIRYDDAYHSAGPSIQVVSPVRAARARPGT